MKTEQELIDEIEELKDALKDAESDLKDAEAEIEDLENKVDELETDLRNLEDEEGRGFDLSSLTDKMKYDFFRENFDKISLEQLESLVK